MPETLTHTAISYLHDADETITHLRIKILSEPITSEDLYQLQKIVWKAMEGMRN